MIIRKGTQADLASVEQLYNDIHTAEETGQQTIGWIRGVYPTRATAQAALDANDLFVLEDAGEILGAARINKAQVDSYAEGAWEFSARDELLNTIEGTVPAPDAMPAGCRFAPRCPYGKDRCMKEKPGVYHAGNSLVSCFRYEGEK